MELVGRRRIRLLIILAALVFSSVIFLTGSGPGSCGWPGNGGGVGGGNNPPPAASTCNQNSVSKVYNCNINITITNTAGYGQSGGVSVTVANPQ